jgi:hypothetical protein
VLRQGENLVEGGASSPVTGLTQLPYEPEAPKPGEGPVPR